MPRSDREIAVPTDPWRPACGCGQVSVLRRSPVCRAPRLNMDDPRDEFAGAEQVHPASDVPNAAPATAGCFDTEILPIGDVAGFKRQLSELTPEELCELLALIKANGHDS